jgi:hypothetical protein
MLFFYPVFGYVLWKQRNEITEFLKWNWNRSRQAISVWLEDESFEEDEDMERGREAAVWNIHVLRES